MVATEFGGGYSGVGGGYCQGLLGDCDVSPGMSVLGVIARMFKAAARWLLLVLIGGKEVSLGNCRFAVASELLSGFYVRVDG